MCKCVCVYRYCEYKAKREKSNSRSFLNSSSFYSARRFGFVGLLQEEERKIQKFEFEKSNKIVVNFRLGFCPKIFSTEKMFLVVTKKLSFWCVDEDCSRTSHVRLVVLGRLFCTLWWIYGVASCDGFWW